MDNIKLFLKNNEKVKNAAIFLSGSGTNAIKVIEYWKENNCSEWAACRNYNRCS